MSANCSIVLIGAGNVATHLGKALRSAGHNLLQVYSRTSVKAERLAAQLGTNFTTSLQEVNMHADIYFIAVSDSAIADVLAALPPVKGIVAHTSGVTPHSIVSDHGFTGGYFYPLQTFVAKEELDLSTCPIFVQANNTDAQKFMLKIAKSISNNCAEISDHQKQVLHLSAVVVNNFVNHLFALTTDFLNQHELDFKYLEPIINTTIQKAIESHPKALQTGPALRQDHNTINAHLSMLDQHPLLKKVYKRLSKSITKYYE